MPGETRYLLTITDETSLHAALHALSGVCTLGRIDDYPWLCAGGSCGVTLRRLDKEDGPFVSSPAGGLVRLLALAHPLLVTEQQEAEAAAILGEPDKEDPDRRVWLKHDKSN